MEKSKQSSFWRVIFSHSTKQQQAISRSDSDVWQKVGFIPQPVTTRQVLGPRRNSKALPKVKLAQKKKVIHCLAVCCQFDSLQLSEFKENHYIWDVCSANRWDALKTATPAAGFGKQKGPNSSPQWCPTRCHTTNSSKVEWIRLWSLASSAIFTFHWLPPLQATQLLLAGKMLPQPSGGRKCFPRVHQIPRHVFLLFRNKQAYF